jgi:fibronectin type 3 domain-containing protein
VALPTGSSPSASSFPLTIRRQSAQAVELSWPPLWGAGTFAVYQAQGATALAFAFATGTQSTVLTGLVPGVEYTLQVRARNVADVEFAVSNPVTITPDQ